MVNGNLGEDLKREEGVLEFAFQKDGLVGCREQVRWLEHWSRDSCSCLLPDWRRGVWHGARQGIAPGQFLGSKKPSSALGRLAAFCSRLQLSHVLLWFLSLKVLGLGVSTVPGHVTDSGLNNVSVLSDRHLGKAQPAWREGTGSFIIPGRSRVQSRTLWEALWSTVYASHWWFAMAAGVCFGHVWAVWSVLGWGVLVPHVWPSFVHPGLGNSSTPHACIVVRGSAL